MGRQEFDTGAKVKTVKQSIWPVSVFGLGFLLLILGLSGVASIQETRRIHEQILSVEDNYRHIERLAEAIRTDISRVAVLRRDRLLETNGATQQFSQLLAGLRTRTEANLDQLRALRSEQGAFDRLANALHTYLDTVNVEFRDGQSNPSDFSFDTLGSQRTTIFAVTEELEKLNEENFESRRKALNQSVVNLQNDIWETILTALVLGSVIAGASIFRISALERETADHQRATEQAEDRLRLLSQQLVSSQEQERKSLSRELHDEIGQLLTALRMELGNMERAHGTPSGDPLPHLEQAKKLAENTLRTTRDIAMGLRPAMLDLLGLGPALEWQTREFSRRYKTPIHL
jgi:signal transduction histidine kinase